MLHKKRRTVSPALWHLKNKPQQTGRTYRLQSHTVYNLNGRYVTREEFYKSFYEPIDEMEIDYGEEI